MRYWLINVELCIWHTCWYRIVPYNANQAKSSISTIAVTTKSSIPTIAATVKSTNLITLITKLGLGIVAQRQASGRS